MRPTNIHDVDLQLSIQTCQFWSVLLNLKPNCVLGVRSAIAILPVLELLTNSLTYSFYVSFPIERNPGVIS